MESKKINKYRTVVAHQTFAKEIRIGKVKKKGKIDIITWGEDVTDTAISSVASFLLEQNEKLVFYKGNQKFELLVQSVDN